VNQPGWQKLADLFPPPHNPFEERFCPITNRAVRKKQQLRWRKKGAHLPLRVRAQVLNENLRSTFEPWYRAMTSTDVLPALGRNYPV